MGYMSRVDKSAYLLLCMHAQCVDRRLIQDTLIVCEGGNGRHRQFVEREKLEVWPV